MNFAVIMASADQNMVIVENVAEVYEHEIVGNIIVRFYDVHKNTVAAFNNDRIVGYFRTEQ